MVWGPIVNGEKITVTGAYEDVATGKLIISFASPVSANGKLTGILGVDVLLDTLSKGADQITVGNTGYVTIYDKDNNIIFHPDDSLILSNVAQVNYSDNLKKAIINDETEQMIEYTRDGETYNGSTAHLENADYAVLGLMPADKIAKGELDVEVNVSGEDEVGQLAEDIRAIVARLKSYILYIDEITAVLKEIGTGNFVFTLQQDYQGEFGKVKTAFLEVRSTISEALKSVVVAADQVASGADQIADGAQAQA